MGRERPHLTVVTDADALAKAAAARLVSRIGHANGRLAVCLTGHTASLFPGHAELEEKERWVVGVDEAGLEPFVPRVTLTFPTLASTREMLFLVGGRDKRGILTRVLSGADLPATRAHSDGNLVW